MTDYTKYNCYDPDGGGRDTYITYDKGGHVRIENKQTEEKHILPKIVSLNSHHFFCKQIPPIQYRFNGTGRDLYIL